MATILDWPGVFRVLWRRKLFLFGFLLIVLGTTAVWVHQMPKTYEAHALVMLNEGRARTVPGFEDAVPHVSLNEERLQGQVLLIRSRGMAERLVGELHLHLLPEFNPALRPQSTSFINLLDLIELVSPGWAETMMMATSSIELTDQQQAELLRAEIIKNVLRRIRAEPATRSTMLTLTFVSNDPALVRRLPRGWGITPSSRCPARSPFLEGSRAPATTATRKVWPSSRRWRWPAVSLLARSRTGFGSSGGPMAGTVLWMGRRPSRLCSRAIS